MEHDGYRRGSSSPKAMQIYIYINIYYKYIYIHNIDFLTLKNCQDRECSGDKTNRCCCSSPFHQRLQMVLEDSLDLLDAPFIQVSAPRPRSKKETQDGHVQTNPLWSFGMLILPYWSEKYWKDLKSTEVCWLPFLLAKMGGVFSLGALFWSTAGASIWPPENGVGVPTKWWWLYIHTVFVVI